MNRILSKSEQKAMRKGGQILANILEELSGMVAPGVSTADLDKRAEERLAKAGVESSFKGYQGYPAVLCTSLNNEVVHCIPSAERLIEEGDLVSLDFGLILDGIHVDAARTIPAGKISAEARALMEATRMALDRGIQAARAGNTTGDIGYAVQSEIEPHGYGIVTALVGHGIGDQLHMEPQIPNRGEPGRGVTLEVGQALAIEPMITAGGPDVEIEGWSVTTKDGSLSAHFEDTVLITKTGPEIMTWN